MNKSLLPAVTALAFVALAGGARAQAQRPEGSPAVVPAPVVSMPLLASPAGTPPTSPVAASRAAGPVSAPPTTVTLARPQAPAPVSNDLMAAQDEPGFPMTRALVIGGAALVIGGLFIGGDTGAIVSLTGGTAVILGLYLHYR